MSERNNVEITVSGSDAKDISLEHQVSGASGMIMRGLFWREWLMRRFMK